MLLACQSNPNPNPNPNDPTHSPQASSRSAPSPDDRTVREAVEDVRRGVQSSRRRLSSMDVDSESVESWHERLRVMVDMDQIARGATLAPRPGQPSHLTAKQTQALMHSLAPVMRDVDAHNHPYLVELLESRNPFSISTFGEQAARDAWLLVQHADRDPRLQRKALQLMQQLPSQDVSLRDMAYLEDRLAVADGRPQRFGTQGRCVPGSGWQPFELADAATVDRARQGVGLGSLAEYRAMFRGQCPP